MTKSNWKSDRLDLSATGLPVGEDHVVIFSANELREVLVHLDEKTAHKIVDICVPSDSLLPGPIDRNEILRARHKFLDEILNRKTEIRPVENPSSVPPLEAKSQPPALTPSPPTVLTAADVAKDYYHRDAALFSYTAGVLGAVAFMGLAIGPGWLGFVVSYLPASVLAAWAGTGHD